MRKIWFAILALFAFQAQALDFDNSWSEQDLPLRASNNYSLGGGALGVASDGGVSILYRSVFAPVTQASWNWSVSQSVPATNVRQKGGDDRNLSVYFVFMPSAASESAKGQGIRKLLGNEAAKAVIYTYGGNDARGARYQSPYMQGRGLVIIEAPAGVASGRSQVNLVADYQAAYGAQPEVLVGIGISSDSDDTNASVRAQISNLQIQ